MKDAMRSIVPEEMHPRDAYRLLTSVVVPRPIAWVSTSGTDGSLNLAPFSYFNAVASSPPTVMISVGRRENQPKDTLRNAQETGEFVVNIAGEPLLPALNETSGEWEYGVNEFDIAGLETTPSVEVRPPRVAVAAVAMEARVTQLVPVEGSRYTMILGRIVRFHIREGLLRANGLVDAARLRPIARLGGEEFATIGAIVAIARPKV